MGNLCQMLQDTRVIDHAFDDYIHHSPSTVLIHAAKYNRVDVIGYVIRSNRMPVDTLIDRISKARIKAAKYGHRSVLEYFVNRFSNEYSCKKDTVLSHISLSGVMVARGHLEAVKWWCTVSDANTLLHLNFRTAVHYGQITIMEWLHDIGRTCQTLDISPTINHEKRVQTLALLHKWKIGGSYQIDCNSGVCIVCRVQMMWNSWEMEENDYTSWIQWIPREVLEDTLDDVLLVTCHRNL